MADYKRVVALKAAIAKRRAEYAALCEFNCFRLTESEEYLAETRRLETELERMENMHG